MRAFKTPQGKQFRSLFIGNLNTTMPEATLREACEQFGVIDDLTIRNDRHGYPSMAFIKFRNPRDAERALAKLDRSTLYGRVLTVAWARYQ